MRELQAILESWRAIRESGGGALLATVVEVSGSTYRRPGARMMMTPDHWLAGSISGGCLEGSLLDEAWLRTQDGPTVVTYDSTSDDDIVWGFGLGCRGMVRVIVERLAPDFHNPLRFVEECFERRQAGALATVLSSIGTSGAKVGSRLFLHADGSHRSSIQDPALQASLLQDARVTLSSNRSSRKDYPEPGGNVEVFLEVIHPPQSLLVFGAGHDAVPLVRLAKEMGWHVTVVDWRPNYASFQRFPEADQRVVCQPGSIGDELRLDSDAAAIVMTHHYLHDQEIVRTLSGSPVRFIGMLGPRSRTDRLLSELAEEGVTLSEDRRDAIHGPVGLDIGADSPETIALAIVAEVEAALSARPGGFLRDRQGPLHGL
ncbi:MAG: XdhC family protein [Armatimonadota bacterium]|nr:XdhC family protein [Armatimonadota bacterium]